jgi:exodeoxyribonuclease VII large subunit
MPDLFTSTRPAPAERDIYTVSRLNREVRALLEGGFPLLWLEGELSNLARPGSGHWYFTLKDGTAQVRCALFRQRTLGVRIAPRDGLRVLVRARVGLYEPRGEFQLVIEHMEDAGEGELRRRFEELKARLAAAGLFDTERKRPLPTLPRRIGVVTSPTGAAIRDILHILGRRFPAIPVMIYPVPVQGTGAAQQIAAAIRLAGRREEVDVLIVARGGGSLEDLWAFNEEVVAQAIVDSPVPVVTGIGHEVDFTIADFTADVRAPTPSGAAELCVPDQREWQQRLVVLAERLTLALRRRVGEQRQALQWRTHRLERVHPRLRIQQQQQRVDELEGRLLRTVRQGLARRTADLSAVGAHLARLSPRIRVASLLQRRELLTARLEHALRLRLERAQSAVALQARALDAVSPLATLQRGYAIVERVEGGVIVDAATVAPGDQLRARLARGQLRVSVEAVDLVPPVTD